MQLSATVETDVTLTSASAVIYGHLLFTDLFNMVLYSSFVCVSLYLGEENMSNPSVPLGPARFSRGLGIRQF